MKPETDDRAPEHNNRKLQTVCHLAATDGRYFLQGLEEGSSRFSERTEHLVSGFFLQHEGGQAVQGRLCRGLARVSGPGPDFVQNDSCFCFLFRTRTGSASGSSLFL